jgi:hypothetical protein
MLSQGLVMERTLSAAGGWPRVSFIVGSYYRALSGMLHVSFPWKIIWKSRVPPRVAFFVWMVALGRILTIDNLRRRRDDFGLVLHVQEGKGDS